MADRVVDRGEQISLLVDKTDRLDATSLRFRRSSKRVKKKMWWKNAKLWIIIVLIILVGWQILERFRVVLIQ